MRVLEISLLKLQKNEDKHWRLRVFKSCDREYTKGHVTRYVNPSEIWKKVRNHSN